METIKINPKTQKNMPIFVNKYSNQPVGKQSQIRQKNINPRKNLRRSNKKMAETNQDVDE